MSIMNTYVNRSEKYGGGKTVWFAIDEKHPVGGQLDVKKFKVGDLIPAGSMVALGTMGGKAEIVTKDDADKLKSVKGLTESDIFVREGTYAITTAVVTKGQVEADLIPEVPMEVRNRLSGISFIDRVEKQNTEGEVGNE